MLSCLILAGGLNAQAVTTNYTSGTFDAEVSWQVVDVTNNILVDCYALATTGAYGSTNNVVGGSTIEVRTWESFGDGWDGAVLTVSSVPPVAGTPIVVRELAAAGECESPRGNGSSSGCAAPDASGLVCGSFMSPMADCEIVCPGDITLDTAPGICQSEPFILPPPTFDPDGCNLETAGTFIDFSNTGDLLFDALGLIKTQMDLAGVPTMLPICATEIEVTVGIQGDINFNSTAAGVGERTFILGEDCLTPLGITGFGGQCGGLEFATVTVSAADYNTWAADGTLSLFLDEQGGIDNICVDQTFDISTSIPTECNAFNVEGAPADGIFPLGETCVIFTGTGSGTGSGAAGMIPLQCKTIVTVEDNEPPTLTCPGDFTFNLQGGECCQLVSYEVLGDDNCMLGFNLNDQTSIANSFCDPCEDPSGGSALACSGGSNSVITIISGVTPGTGITEVCFNQETFGTSTSVTVNVYCYDGVNIPFEDGAGTFVPFVTETFPLVNANNGACVCLEFAMPVAVPAGCTDIAVEFFNATGRSVQTPAACDGNGATGNLTYLVGPACGITAPTLMSGIGFALDAGMTASFAPPLEPVETDPDDAMTIDPTWTTPVFPDGATVNEFDTNTEFPIGEHCFFYTLGDASGNFSSCQWCITVNEIPEELIVTSLACNNHVNISLDQECEVFISADMFLEGGPYGCYFNCYEVYITDDHGQPVAAGCGMDAAKGGNTNPDDLNGCTVMLPCGDYTVMVYDACNDNTCWGTLLVEDKIAPIVNAPDDITLNCLQSVEPGTPLFGDSQAGSEPNISWPDAGAGATGDVASITYTIPPATTGAIITDINVEVGLDHSWMGDITMTLTGPNGASVNLYQPFCTFNDNLWAVFDEEAGNGPACAGVFTTGTHEDCNDPALYLTGAAIGAGNNIQTAEFAGGGAGLTQWYGQPVGGDYTLSINDGAGGDGGCLQLVNIDIQWTCPAPAEATIENPCGEEELVYTDQYFDNGCDGAFIERTWVATDEKGNSGQAVQIITINQIGLSGENSEWFWPAGIVDLTCGASTDPEDIFNFFAVYDCLPSVPQDICDCNAHAAGARMAYPFFFNKKGLQERFDINNCNMFFTYSDQVLPACGPGCNGNNKIIRTWTALDWCTGMTSNSIQVIHAKDNEGPTFDAPADFVVSASPWGCAASFVLPDPIHISDNCSEDVFLTIFGAPGTVTEMNAGPYQDDNGVWRVQGLPKGGPHEYIYVAEDCCGNPTSASVFVTVVDGTAPIAVAKQNIVISLTSSPTDPDGGIAKLFAPSVDNGSHDGDCGPVRIAIRRENLDDDAYCGSLGIDEHNNNETFFNFNDLPNNQQPTNHDQDDTDNGDFVKFCCQDLIDYGVDADGDGIPDYALIDVELGVWDDADMDGWPGSTLNDRFSTTWATVRVEAKLAPNLSCPPLVKLTCEMDEKDLSITGVATGGSTCGTLNTVFEDLCGLDINQDGEIADFEIPEDETLLINEVGMCTDVDKNGVIANWTAVEGDIVWEDLFNKACHYGPITRWWSIEGTSIMCRQIIILEEPTTLFDGDNVIDWPYSENEFINLVSNDGASCSNVTGSDITQVGLGATPDFAEVLMTCVDDLCDEPVWVDANCSLVGWSLDSDTFFFEGDACRKIINTYTVIDWCQYDPNSVTSEGIWTWTVIGKLIDTYDPVVTAPDDMFPAVPGAGGSGGFPTNGACVGFAQMKATAFDTAVDADGNVIDDACPSQWLKWNVYVDINNDWVFDREWSSFVAEDKNTTADPLWSEDNAADNLAVYGYLIPDVRVGNRGGVDNATDFATAPGFEYIINIPDAIPADCGEQQHRVVWKVYDGCGNVTSTVSYFTVQDKKAPTPYCINLSTALMADPDGAGPAGPMVELWAIDFDFGSFDNCTDDESLRFTFSDVPPELDSTYIVDRRSSAAIFDCEVFTTTNSTLITLPVYVWDECGNSDFCNVQLRIIDNTGDCNMPGSGSMIAGSVATEFGEFVENVEVMNENMTQDFVWPGMTENNGEYEFAINNDGDDFQLTANKDGDDLNGVSTLDLVLIQRHILGIESLDSPYKLLAADVNNDGAVTALDLIEIRKLILGIYSEFPSVDSWMFLEAAQTLDMSNLSNYDTAIDIYDLTIDRLDEDFIGVKMGDVNSSVVANVNSTSTETRSAASIEIAYEAKNVLVGETFDVTVTANQLSDVYGYQFTMATGGLQLVDITSAGIDVSEANFGNFDNKLTTSWNSINPVKMNGDLFTLTFKSSVEGKLSDILSLNSKVTKAEAYVGSDLQIVNIELRDGNATSSDAFALNQNEPNPFTNNTVIGFVMPESADATMTIIDVTGKVIKVIEGNYAKGYNEIELSKSDLGAAGILHYQLVSGDFTATKKMIIIE